MIKSLLLFPFRLIGFLFRLTMFLLFLPLIIGWRILQTVAPELTGPLEGLAQGLGRIFRLR